MNAPSEPTPSVLLTPGERVGWVFRDRNLLRRRFTEPVPNTCAPLRFELVNQVQVAKAKMPKRMLIAGGISMLVTLCLASGNSAWTMILAALSLLGGLGVLGLIGAHYAGLKHEIASAEARRQHAYADWQARKAAFEQAEQDRVDQLLEWGAAAVGPGTHRVDIVGGNLWGWEALLTVYGTSLLATRGAMTLVDLSGEAVSRELLKIALKCGTSLDALLLPSQLDQSDLLVGLPAQELVDTLIESIYAGEETASRADRSMDDRILTAVCGALGEPISIARLATALRVLMDEPGDLSVLTPEEQRFIADELFGEVYRRQAHGNLRRLESFMHPLIGLGTRRHTRPAAMLTCLAMATDGINVRNELLNDLIVQWLIRRIAHDTAGMSSLVIAGADEIPRRHIERLSDLCERRDVRLVLLFRHLRETALKTLGTGTVGFMRLGNHTEATEAADFIGREHKFAFTQLTQTLGGNQTHTSAEAEGEAVSEGSQRSRSKSGDMWLFGLRGKSLNWSRTESENWSISRNWSQTRSEATGTNWSDAASQQRVYEYTVEPVQLQRMPDYAMLMVQSASRRGKMLVPVECNPDLISMPRLSMEPLPEEPPIQDEEPPPPPGTGVMPPAPPPTRSASSYPPAPQYAPQAFGSPYQPPQQGQPSQHFPPSYGHPHQPPYPPAQPWPGGYPPRQP